MVTQSTTRRDVFTAIADPTRRAIIELLSKRELSLNGVAEHFAISRPAISKHVKILEECGLVSIEQKGRERICALDLRELSEASEWLEKYRQLWERRFDALEEYLAVLQAGDADKTKVASGQKKTAQKRKQTESKPTTKQKRK